MLEIAPGGWGESWGAGTSCGHLPRWTEPRRPRSGRTRGERGGAATGRAQTVPLLQDSTPGTTHNPCASDEAQAPAVRHYRPTQTRAAATGRRGSSDEQAASMLVIGRG
ncbi:hypothetical protein NDU88_003967 [Pleurodeles waltl]|uniref:Uncharacterized protein n=1 Tax=Pleurodeles waltl TaxID=8319 RepID=A0AAV7MS42_PLEWA|nr:hypothetical protein NDU88_003967 [Pleurodeles waltl]